MMLGRRTLLAAVGAATVAGVSQSAPADRAPVRALLVSSETGHPYPQTTPLLCKTLLDAGMDVELTLALDRLKAADGLTPFDVIVFAGRHPARDEAAEKALVQFVQGGKGLAVIHIASNSFGGSEEWKRLVGRVWVSGQSGHPPHGPFRVRVEDRGSPITAGLRDFEIEDEMYQKLVVADGAREHVLLSATDGQRTDPMAFTLEHGTGRVFHTTLGHGPPGHRNASFQRLARQGVLWAAGRSGR
jgi:uncharacterized protein